MITIEQKPLKLTPVNTQHIYTVSSPNSGETDFRYVIDLYVDTTTSNPEKITRLLVSPNTYGKGIVNVEDIVKNYVEGNIRSEQPQYTSESTTDTTPYGLITNVNGITPSNGFNGNTDYNTQVHVRDYRAMVGEQWLSGDTTVTYISTDTATPGSTFYAEIDSGRMVWYGAGANIPEGSVLEKGVTYEYQSVTGETFTEDGNFLPASPTPISGYTMSVTEKYSGIIYTFTYQSDGEGLAWILTSITYPSDYDPSLSPDAITIWPGTTLKQGSYTPYLNNNAYWTDTTPVNQHEYWEVKNYLMSGTTVDEAQPSRFLTTAGDNLFTTSNTSAGINTSRVRRRKHHPSCPILVSWFQGLLSSNPDFEFNNDLGCFTTVTAATQSIEYPNAGLTELDISSYQTTGITSQDNRILYHNTIVPNLAGGKVGFWLAGSVGDYQYDGYGYSEFLEFYIEEDDCLSDPVHVAFINRQGVWDTYTLDRKALETKNVGRKTYDTGLITDTNILSLLSSNRRKVIYDQQITETMNVSTWYLEDNDKQIVEDLFMSPEVYIIKDHDWTGKSEKTYNPYLLPVVVNTNSIQEFKNRYTKLAQYNFTLEYTPINEYKTQG